MSFICWAKNKTCESCTALRANCENRATNEPSFHNSANTNKTNQNKQTNIAKPAIIKHTPPFMVAPG